MSAYLIANYKLTNPAAYQRYVPAVMKPLAAGSNSRSSRLAPGDVVVHRWMGLAAALGLAAAMLFTTRPHYLNGAQFAWIATCGLWPFAAPTARTALGSPMACAMFW